MGRPGLLTCVKNYPCIGVTFKIGGTKCSGTVHRPGGLTCEFKNELVTKNRKVYLILTYMTLVLHYHLTCVSPVPLLTHGCTQVYLFSPRNPTDTVYHCETDVSKCVWQQRWCFWSWIFPITPLLAHTCTQVHRFSPRNPADTAYLCETDVSKYVWQQEWHNPVYVRRVDSSSLVFESFITPILMYKSCL